MLARLLDASYAPDVRRHVSLLTLARAAANAAYRFVPPFLAVIADDLGVRLSTVGIAVGVSELSGLAAPALGRRVDRLPRRRAMAAGLVGVALGCAVLALAPGVVVLAAGLVAVALAKIVFDVGLAAWIADHVPLARRGRVVGLTETSWALGLLLGVPLMGLTTALAGWRVAFVLPAVATIAASSFVRARLGADPPPPAPPPAPEPTGPGRTNAVPAVVRVVGAFFLLMAGQQCLVVVYGAWLEDEAGMGGVGLAVVTFLLGGGELLASASTVRLVDRWGALRAVRRGAAVMAPSALALGLLAGPVGAAAGLPLLLAFVVGFEFAIVSLLSLAGELRPASRAAGVGMAIAAGTFGRATLAFPATRLYEVHGIVGPALLSTGLVVVLVVVLTGDVPRRGRGRERMAP